MERVYKESSSFSGDGVYLGHSKAGVQKRSQIEIGFFLLSERKTTFQKSKGLGKACLFTD